MRLKANFKRHLYIFLFTLWCIECSLGSWPLHYYDTSCTENTKQIPSARGKLSPETPDWNLNNWRLIVCLHFWLLRSAFLQNATTIFMVGTKRYLPSTQLFFHICIHLQVTLLTTISTSRWIATVWYITYGTWRQGRLKNQRVSTCTYPYSVRKQYIVWPMLIPMWYVNVKSQFGTFKMTHILANMMHQPMWFYCWATVVNGAQH